MAGSFGCWDKEHGEGGWADDGESVVEKLYFNL